MVSPHNIDYTVQLPTFEGPLDLLLRLIERQELDITSVALTRVADQYLAHVRAIEHPDPSALSAFLVVAAKLLVIKSRALLPRPAVQRHVDEPPDEGAELARQLREYQRFKQAATLLHTWQAQGRRSYVRSVPPPVIVPAPTQRLDATLEDMIAAVQRRVKLLASLEQPAVPLPTPKIITVPEMAERIRARLRQQEWVDFTDFLSLTVQRVEVVVTLWAVLEMLKRRAIVVEQHSLFGPIQIGRGPDLERALILDEADAG